MKLRISPGDEGGRKTLNRVQEYFISMFQPLTPTLPPLTRTVLLFPCWGSGGGGGSCRYCAICIPFPRRPVGRPRAVSLSANKAASHRLPEHRWASRGQDVTVVSAPGRASVPDTGQGKGSRPSRRRISLHDEITARAVCIFYCARSRESRAALPLQLLSHLLPLHFILHRFVRPELLFI